MIPVKLTLDGFLSYREKVELDFSQIDLACVIGQNGAGKSSLMDAITWALFGKARSGDDDLVNLNAKQAIVWFEFSYEDQLYRIERSKKKGSSKKVLLNVWNPEDEIWADFSEATSTKTQEKLERILRMDYETFINASFFLQGKADQFAQQRPSDRKKTLVKILELDVWESRKLRVAAKRKKLKTDLAVLDSRLDGIEQDLAREPQLLDELETLKERLQQNETIVETQEKLVDGLRKVQQQVTNQKEQVRIWLQNLHRASNRLQSAQQLLDETQNKQTKYQDLLATEEEVKANYELWQQQQAELDEMDATSLSFNAISHQREEPQQRLIAEEARLKSEFQHLIQEEEKIQVEQDKLGHLQQELAETREEEAKVQAEVSQYTDLEDQSDALDDQKRDLEPMVIDLRGELQRLMERKRKLEKLDAVECPTCGQPLTSIHRKEILSDLNETGRALKAEYEEKKVALDELKSKMSSLESEIFRLKKKEETELVKRIHVKIRSHEEYIQRIQDEIAAWNKTGEQRLAEVIEILNSENYCKEERRLLALIADELKQMGYDPAEHENLRQKVHSGRQSQQDFQALNEAKGVLAELSTVYQSQLDSVTAAQEEVNQAKSAHQQTESVLVELENAAGDYTAETRKLMTLRNDHNQIRQSVGGAEQRLNSLIEKRSFKETLLKKRIGLTNEIGQHEILEEAFGKNGVQALLIEQSLPEIEMQANVILEKLSTSGMTVQLRTQAEYKDKKRENEMKETLDIIISDEVGVRPYEMYSGGEAFRVNFAIRLALSRMLAARTGARLQTLVIDEGFGSQDTDGVQRLVTTINSIKKDFAKIFVITHLESLKDAFPTQIEVSKSPTGSHLQIAHA